MLTKSYEFTVGSIECAVLLDGATKVNTERFLQRFPGATEAEYRRAYAEIGLSLDEADSSFNILVAKVGDDVMLVDGGEGGRPTGGEVVAALRGIGLAPDHVTLVVVTHADGDHVMGLLGEDGTPTFPRATYVMSSEEQAYWQGRIDAGIVAHGPIAAMMRERGVRLIGMDDGIVPGVRAVPLPGHTPGMIAVEISSEGERLIHLSDLLHSPMQFAHPEWSARFDRDTAVSVPTRREALGRAADEGMLALFYHLTFPGLGRVRRSGSAFRWEPLSSSQR